MLAKGQTHTLSLSYLFGLGRPAVLLQTTDLSLQLQVGLLQLTDLFQQLADVAQVAQTRTQRSRTCWLFLERKNPNMSR